MLNFRKHLKVGLALAALIVSTSASLYSDCCSLEPVSEFSLTGGWRRDNFKGKVENFKTTIEDTISGKEEELHTHLEYEQELRLKNLDIWQIGCKLQFGFPECFCDCDTSWLGQFYVKGFYDYGWISDGKLHDCTFEKFAVSAKTHKGRTIDGSIALGYLIPVCENFGVAPVGGYAYHQLRANFKDTHFDDESLDCNIDKRFTSTWKGPWLGVDAVYYMDWCGSCVRFDLGYEYHWGKWTGERTIDDEFGQWCEYFSDKRHSHKVQGQVGYITAWWPVCDCWEIGLGVNYNYFKARKGSQEPRDDINLADLCDVETPHTVFAKSKDVSWRSVGVTLDLGYRF